MKKILLAALFVCLGNGVQAQFNSDNVNTETRTFELKSDKINERLGSDLNPTVTAKRIVGDEIQLDGFLDESIWSTVSFATGYTQSSPNDAAAPSQRTEARILYTDKYIYVGIMAFDTAVDSLTKPLFRKDGRDASDWVYASFDSYNDNRTAFSFAVNPRGVRKDVLYYDDKGEDILWDPVWEAEAQILDNGWSVEMKIPLSQLRFNAKEYDQLWGVNFQRRIARFQEINFWSPTPRNENGFVSKFGILKGISNLDEPRRLEITPYVSSVLERAPGNPSNPFYNENEINSNFGGDIKYGLTSDLTLTATLNPDFGQVEADPSTLNLSQFEQFFSERRPFFLEGNEIFRFGNTKNYHKIAYPNTFYSRRIGGAPESNFSRKNNSKMGGVYYDASDPNNSATIYTNSPRQTRILGAAKLSGKNKKGTSIGVLYARTAEEKSPFDLTVENSNLGNPPSTINGSFRVQPAKNYLVTRLKQDFNGGESVIGGFFSGINRDIEGSYFEDFLPKSAFITGADFEHSWNNRRWIFSGVSSLSNVNGSKEAILRTQYEPQRYFQRVDSDDLSIDANKTSLTGSATEISFQKASGEHWTWSVSGSIVTPDYESNDIGFQSRANYRAVSYAVMYTERNPKYLQSYTISNKWKYGRNSDNDLIRNEHIIGLNARFKNLWSVNFSSMINLPNYDERITRGGPMYLMPWNVNNNFHLNSNPAKKITVGHRQSHQIDGEGEYRHSYNVDFSYRPTSFIQMTIEPNIEFKNNLNQYVTTRSRSVNALDTDLTYGNRYVFSDIEQTTVSTEFRLNWTFNTSMSLQTYLRPFIASGKYSNLKEFRKPRDHEFDIYGVDQGTIIINANGSQTVDPDDAGGEDPFTIRPLDFTVTSLQGNAVFRWEYRPGSTLFLVWQQQRDGRRPEGEFVFLDDFTSVLDPKPINVFLVKLSYWFGN